MNEVEVDEASVQLLCKYCSRSPAEVGRMVDRIVSEWYARAAKEWYRNPALIPAIRQVPESRTMKVRINVKHAITYKFVLKKLGLNEADLTSWLCQTFIKAWDIKKRAETIRGFSGER